MRDILSAFIHIAELHPENTAIVHNDIKISYQELNRRSDELYCALRQVGVAPQHHIPVVAQRSVEMIVAILAILKTGASYIPVDIHYPQKRIQQIISGSGAPVVVISHCAFLSAISAAADNIIAVDNMSPQSAPAPQPIISAAEDPAYVIFTSGTTGVPKGVVIPHGALYNLISWHNARFGVDSGTRSSLIAGIGFDVAQWEIWSPLVCGAVLVLPDNEEIRLRAEGLLRFFSNRGITHGFIPTVLVPGFTALRPPPGLALRYLFTAGEKLGPVRLDNLPYRLVDYYGPTEATIFATCNLVECATAQPQASIGYPVAGAQVFILDNALRPVADGEPGELFIAGPGLATGYLAQPALTAEVFIFPPFMPGVRMYRSGDSARRLPDGRIQFLGRLDAQIKIRGNRIEPGEIESVLMQVPGVKAAVALVDEDASTGEKRLLAFAAAHGVGEETLRRALTEALPDYFMPAAIRIVPQIPLTPNGKTDRQALLAGYHSTHSPASTAPLQGREALLAEIWQSLLKSGLPGPDDDFFALGGHSLLAAQLAAAVGARTGIRTYVRDIYEAPTVRSLTQTLNERQHAGPPAADSEPLRVLQDDVFLAEDLTFCAPYDEAQITAPRAIFLTGATGFVGSHLLADLLHTTGADIYCLVRSPDNRQAGEKIAATLARYDIALSDEQQRRIVPLAGDLAEPDFAMARDAYRDLYQRIDIIYHSASAVNFIQPYSWMKRDNVQGLREIIRFAAGSRLKPLILLSTISVYSWGHLHTGKRIMYEADDIDQNLPAVITDIGYVRSKWVMEKIADLAAAKGLPLMTFRLGYATCHSRTGASADYQWWGRLVKTCLESGTVPLLHDLREGLTTVDYMTRAIAAISRNPRALGHKFNLIHDGENNLTLEAFFEQLEKSFGFRFRRLPYQQWLAQWETDPGAPLYPLLSLFKDNMTGGRSTVELYQETYLWDCRNVRHFLQGSGISEPRFDREVLARYLQRSLGREDIAGRRHPVL